MSCHSSLACTTPCFFRCGGGFCRKFIILIGTGFLRVHADDVLANQTGRDEHNSIRGLESSKPPHLVFGNPAHTNPTPHCTFAHVRFCHHSYECGLRHIYGIVRHAHLSRAFRGRLSKLAPLLCPRKPGGNTASANLSASIPSNFCAPHGWVIRRIRTAAPARYNRVSTIPAPTMTNFSLTTHLQAESTAFAGLVPAFPDSSISIRL